MEKLHERIKRLRKANKLSVEEIAKKLNISRATYYRYENKDVEKLPYTILEPLARLFNTTPAYLLGWEDDNNVVPILARSETERDELISLQRNYKDLGEDQREKLQSYLEFLRSQKPSMPEDDDID